MKKTKLFSLMMLLGISIHMSPTSAQERECGNDYAMIHDFVKVETQNIIYHAFQEKNLDQICDKLCTSINNALGQKQMDPNDLFISLSHQTLIRLENDLSFYSYTKKWLWGQSHTLYVLGVLKSVMTILALPIDEILNIRINEHLKALKFYSGYTDYGVYGFNVQLGHFSNLVDSYNLYTTCIITVNRISNLPPLTPYRIMGWIFNSFS